MAQFQVAPVQAYSDRSGRRILADQLVGVAVENVRDGRKRCVLCVTTPSAFELSPDGRWLAISQREPKADLREANVTNAEGQQEYAIGDVSWRVRLFEVASGQSALELPPMPGLRFIRFAQQGRLIAVASHREIRLYDALGKGLGEWKTHSAPLSQLTFAPDGRSLISEHGDDTALVWDLTPHLKPAVPSTVPFEQLWSDLSSNAAAGYRAMWEFADSGPEAEAFLKQHMKPAPKPDLAHLRRWADGLGDPSFAVREAATRGLRKQLSAARPMLEAIQRESKLPEARRRATELLALPDVVTAPEELRQIRATAALERAGAEQFAR
jgi:hypothetical protein